MKLVGNHIVKRKYKLLKPEVKHHKISYKRIFKVYKYKEYIKTNDSKKLNLDSICLFFDRLDMACDNAEVLYEHMIEYPNKFFVLKQECSDYDRLKAKGFNMVVFGSVEFTELYEKCDFIFSSSFDYEITNYKSLAKNASFNFVFLQHGVIYNDLRHHLNERFIDYIVCSTIFEKNLLINEYLFEEWQIIDSGLARYDRLKSIDNKYLVLAPSWNASMRKPFSTSLDMNQFKNSLFFENVVDILLNTNAKLLLHPNYREAYPLFVEVVGVDKIINGEPYYKVINESSGVISDYSSIVFDYIYLSKPVYYFDLCQDFKNHLHKPKLVLGVELPGTIIKSIDEINYQSTNNDIFINNDNHCQKIVEYLKNI